MRGIVPGVTSAMWSPCSPFVRVDEQAAQRLGEEVRRLLGHDVAVAGDRRDRGDRRRVEQERGVDAVAGVDPVERLARRSACTTAGRPRWPRRRCRAGARGRPGGASRRGSRSAAPPCGRSASRAAAPGGEDRPAGARPEAEPAAAAVAARRVRRSERRLQRVTAGDPLDREQGLGRVEQPGPDRPRARRRGGGSAGP